MQMRKWLLSTIICSGFAVVATGAQASQSIQPISNWTTSKITASRGADAYCALARRFDQDLILTLARNVNNESSLAIDFGRDTLKKSQSYEVALKTDVSNVRSYNIEPVSGKALVIRLGGDTDFYDTLGRAKILDMSVAGKQYAFNMTDFGKGRAELESCLVSLSAAQVAQNSPAAAQTAQALADMAPAAGNAAPAGPVGGAAGSEVASVTPLPLTPETAEKAAPSYVPVRGAPPPPVAVRVPEGETAREQANLPVTDDVVALRQENLRLRNALERERRLFENQFMAENDGSSRASELDEKLRLLHEENSSLRTQLSQTARGGASVAAAPVAAASCPAPEKNTDTAQISKMTEDMVALKAENAQLKTSVDGLKSQLATASAQAATAASVTPAQAQELSALKARVAEYETQMKALTDKTNTQIADYQAQLKSASDAEKARLARFEADLKEAQANAARVGDYEAQAKLVQEQAAQIASYQVQLKAAQEQSARIPALETELAAARADASRVSTYETALKTAQAQAGRVSDLEAQLQSTQAQAARVADLEAQLKSAQGQAGRVTDLEGQLQSAQGQAARVAELEAQLKAAYGQSGRVAELEAQLKTAQEKLATTTAQSEAAAAQIAALTAQAAGGAADKAALEAANRRAIEAETNLAEANRRVAEAEKKLTDVEQKLASAQTQISDMTQKLASQQSATAATQQTAANTQSLQTRIDELVRENESLKQALTLAKAQSSNVTPVSAAAGGVSVAQVRALEEKLRIVEGERDRYAAQVEQISTQKGDNLVNISSANWDLEQATRRFNEAEREVRRLGLQLEQERGKCATEKKEIEYMLFDPAIATQEQIATLNAYEAKIATLEEKLAAARPSTGAPSAGSEASRLADLAPAAGGQEFRRTPGAVSAVSQAALSPQSVEKEPLAQAVTKEMSLAKGAAPAARLSPEGMQTFLQKAGVSVKGAVKVAADKPANAQITSYSWDTGNLFGSAEQQAMNNAGQFDALATTYMQKTKARCNGDFASVPATNKTEGSIRVQAYEIACVKADGGASASVVFFNQDGVFTAIAHEGSLDHMDSAMDVRDTLVNGILSTRVAAR